MRITINCRSILKENRTGIGRYTYHLIDSLGQIDRANQYCLYAPRHILDFKRRLPAFLYANMRPRYDFFNRGITGADIYHLPSPAQIGRHSGKLVVTVHDLIHRAFPQGHTPQTIEMTEQYMQAIVAGADHIICTSESTRADLHRYYDFPKEKSTAILNGVDHRIFYKLDDAGGAKPLLARLGCPAEFILYVGTIEPRKNVQGVLSAIAALRRKGTEVPPLLIVGMRGWMMGKLNQLIDELGLKSHVILAGFLSDGELNVLYNACRVFLFPSFYEGFGFPIAEAFSAGACVITSNVSSCAEIAADAALLVDPADTQMMADRLVSVLQDDALREALKTKALRKAKAYAFRRTAEATLHVYENVNKI